MSSRTLRQSAPVDRPWPRLVETRASAPTDPLTLEALRLEIDQLDDQMLVIADTDKAVGLAGVIGGLDSEIHDGTTRIILESANFDMKATRRTARELKVRTDASARFERGLDPNLSRDAAARATRLIL